MLNPPHVLNLQNEPPFCARPCCARTKRSPHFRCLNWFNAPSLHHFTLHYTTLHYTLQFSAVGTSEVHALLRTQEKHSFGNPCRARNGRWNFLIWLSFEPDRRPCRPLLQSVTRVAQTLTRYESGDRRIWVKFLAGRKISLFNHTPTAHPPS